MPKRGKNRGWSSDNDFPREPRREVCYYEHDDRSSTGDHTRRVTFKAGNLNRVSKQRRNRIDWDAPLQERLNDDDVDMVQGPSSKGNRRFNPYTGGRGGPRGRGRRQGGRVNSPMPQVQRQKLVDVPSSWYKIMVPYGGKYEKTYILNVLLAHLAPEGFDPIAYKVQGPESTFFVDDYKAAERLMKVDRKITTTDGYKLLVKVRPGLPQMEINEAFKERLKVAMAKRYNAATKALDLERFHMDPDLKDDFVAALFRPTIMQAVLNIAAANIPEMVALNLANNRLLVIDHLNILDKKFANLNILHLANNKIRDIRQLDALKGLNLSDVVLEGNPLTDKFNDKTVYMSEVRKRFPKVIKLDGVALPPPILFDDVEEEVGVPANCGSFLCAVEGGNIVRQFLEQYYRIYDSDNRQPLVEAYHEQATFSMSSAYPPTPGPRLDDYICQSRNLIRIKDSQRREKLTHRGNVDIVSYLCTLPPTMHDAPSFAVDLPLFSPSLLQLCVTGVFREVGEKQHLRSFSRVFIIVPVGAGFCIVNEQLFITNATDLQSKFAFKPVVTPVSSPPVASVVSPVDPNVRLQMVEAVKQQTNMNTLWANKCLEETQWDYQRALTTFASLHSQGSIPAEAFDKSMG